MKQAAQRNNGMLAAWSNKKSLSSFRGADMNAGYGEKTQLLKNVSTDKPKNIALAKPI